MNGLEPTTIAWLQITATTTRSALAEVVFEQWGADAVTVLGVGSELTVEDRPHAHPGFDRACVVGLFAQDTDLDPIIKALRAALGEQAEIHSEPLENQDWASAWLSQHPPLRFGERLWIAPHSAPVEADTDAVVVRLDPGLAFGTGTHPTTALCLRWLACQDLSGKRVLDYGCGSGILAIAAARLGAESVTAVDIDDQATRATRNNAERNAVEHLIDTPPIRAISQKRFDIVLANILAKPLISLAPILTTHAAPNAALVLSGLLRRQIDNVANAYRDRFVFSEPALEDGWARLDAVLRTD